eukprot:evm.model.NODE_34250_length_32101_cov_40.533970.1
MVSRNSSRAKLSEAKAGMQLGRGRCKPSRREETTTLVVVGEGTAWVLAVDRDGPEHASGGGGGGGGGGCGSWWACWKAARGNGCSMLSARSVVMMGMMGVLAMEGARWSAGRTCV